MEMEIRQDLNPFPGGSIPSRQWLNERNNYEQELYELEQPLAGLGKLAQEWRQLYRDKELSRSQLILIIPVLEALLLLPPLTLQDICGEGLEEFYRDVAGQLGYDPKKSQADLA